MEIKDRKNTTETGIGELRSLMESFEFEDDLDTVVGSTFAAKVDIGSDRVLWAEKAEIRIEDGEIDIYAWTEMYGYEPQLIYSPWNIKKIDFEGVMLSIVSAVEKYNKLTEEKDTQIEDFLTFVRPRRMAQ
jgi:hypothetical protein